MYVSGVALEKLMEVLKPVVKSETSLDDQKLINKRTE